MFWVESMVLIRAPLAFGSGFSIMFSPLIRLLWLLTSCWLHDRHLCKIIFTSEYVNNSISKWPKVRWLIKFLLVAFSCESQLAWKVIAGSIKIPEGGCVQVWGSRSSSERYGVTQFVKFHTAHYCREAAGYWNDSNSEKTPNRTSKFWSSLSKCNITTTIKLAD